MLSLVIGQPNSGKSEFAERLVASRAGPTAYVGTLPHLRIFGKRIRRHRLRRPSSWDLIELRGNPYHDTRLISAAMDRYQNILVDGLAFYVFQLFTVFEIEPSEFAKHTRELARSFSRHAGEIVIVDQPVTPIECRKTTAALQHLHITLARQSDQIQLISETLARTIQARELVEIDRLLD
jgi:adenosyl cobinamide kinase/adenosyl cobinamide phosphate guanylyltransferase